MKASAENYKGIEFVRISSLPEDQKLMIVSSQQKQNIIRILRDKELLKDCIQYNNYASWYHKDFKSAKVSKEADVLIDELKLVFK